MNKKKCARCGDLKQYSDFNKDCTTKDGYRYNCRSCTKLRGVKSIKKTDRLNLLSKNKKRCNCCKEVRDLSEFYHHKKGIYSTCIVCSRKKGRDYYKTPHGRAVTMKRAYRHQENEYVYLKNKVARMTLSLLFKDGKDHNYKVKELLGCNRETLVKHLEATFYDRKNTEKMTWDNHGRYGWHIDHIKPCSHFDLSNEEELKACFNYSNTQALWSEDNWCKGIKNINGRNIDKISNLSQSIDI